MNKSTIAAKMLTLLASGGTIERAIAELPMFRTQIESALDWMRKSGRCSDAEISERALRLRELIRRKDAAMKRLDVELAATMRAEECAVFESFGLRCPSGVWHSVLRADVDEQTRELSALFYDTKAV